MDFQNNQNSETEINEDEFTLIDKFEDLDLKDNLLRGIFACGFEKPSVIQQKGIQSIIKGRDVIGQAQSGTGKTATFTIGSLQLLDETNNES